MTKYFTAAGKNHFLKHLKGKELTLSQAIKAKCYVCMGFFVDGKEDCTIKECSLHPFMHYNKHKRKFRNVKTTTKNKA